VLFVLLAMWSRVRRERDRRIRRFVNSVYLMLAWSAEKRNPASHLGLRQEKVNLATTTEVFKGVIIFVILYWWFFLYGVSRGMEMIPIVKEELLISQFVVAYKCFSVTEFNLFTTFRVFNFGISCELLSWNKSFDHIHLKNAVSLINSSTQ
jgi:hypothetical protein